MMNKEIPWRRSPVQASHLTDLLHCPATVSERFHGAALPLAFKCSSFIFRQGDACRGLYILSSGRFMRTTERLGSLVSLGPARPGGVAELSAVLGSGVHTYSLSAQSECAVLLLPTEALAEAFSAYPPLRMQLLQELAREVSQGYNDTCLNFPIRQRGRV